MQKVFFAGEVINACTFMIVAGTSELFGFVCFVLCMNLGLTTT